MLDGELDQLSLAFYFELALQVEAMRLDGSDGQAVALRDLLARQTLRELIENVALARREAFDRIANRRCLDEPRAESFAEERPAVEHRADRANDLRARRVLQHITARAGAHSLRHVFDVVVHRQH